MYLLMMFVSIVAASGFSFSTIHRDFGFVESLRFNGSDTTTEHVPITFPYHLSTFSQQFDPSLNRKFKMKQVQEEQTEEESNEIKSINITVSLQITRRFKKIIDQDDRQKVSDTTVFPWSAIGQLVVRDCVDSDSHTCSAVLISPNVALTAAHCVRRKQEWCKSVWFTTGQSFGFSTLKLDGASPVQMNVLSCWDQNDLNCDVALLHLDWNVGCSTGYMSYGYDCLTSVTKELKVAGFPQDEQQLPNEMYYSSCQDVNIRSCFNMNRTIHDCDTAIGMSGSPLWQEATDLQGETQYQVRAINRGAKVWTPFNVATKISVQVFQWIQFVIGIYSPCT